MKKTKTKCYLYTRVSTSMQVDGYSLDAQRDKLRKYAEYEDMVVAGEYSDEGFSGKNIQGRHEFQRMLQDIQDCKDGVEYVLVFKLSRFGRNAADVLNSLQLMQDFGVNLICVEDGIDSSKDSGKLMISVLSAVAEIERENIRTQTMAGREQKAREGKWNGGFAPYGYRLEKGELLIAEDEVDVIRTIFDRYIHTNDGVSGVAKYLNRQGFVKKMRQNGTIPGFSASFVKSIIDNPVYMGKIAYGRRRTEKKIGTRNEMHVVEQSEFPVYEGKHEAIISEEDWNLAQEKRKVNAYRREKVNDPTHAHILSGILKCPCCGKSLYGNIAKAHSKDKKTRYYYYCKNTVTPTGHECTFRLNIEQTEMNRMVASIISAMVSNPRFADAIKAKIGSAVDTNDLEKQLEALQAQLRQTLGTKARLERQMDGLDVNDPYYDRKISDLQRRYDEQYGAIDEIEVQIDDVQSQIRSIRQEKISGDNIYRLLLAFDQVYEAASEVERKEFMRAFIERIELFPERQPDGNWIRKIIFNFPVPVNGTEVKELPLENETMVERYKMRGKLIVITGVMALGLSACGAQGSDPVGESSSSEVIGSAEAAVTEESTSETGGAMEATASTETISDTAASTTGPSYEDEDAWLSWEDYGECSNTVKDFYNDDEKKTYYYEMDEFYFSDEKYAKVNDYLQQMYEEYRAQYEEEGENHTGAYELVDETLSEGQRYDDNYLVFNGITLADDEYVSLHFNDTVYYAGAAHPLSYYIPVTISVATGEEVTPEEVLGKTWDEIRAAGSIEEENEENFNADYGFYITEKELCYLYRTNFFVEEIRIPR